MKKTSLALLCLLLCAQAGAQNAPAPQPPEAQSVDYWIGVANAVKQQRDAAFSALQDAQITNAYLKAQLSEAQAKLAAAAGKLPPYKGSAK